jgi:hypothetical protein
MYIFYLSFFHDRLCAVFGGLYHLKRGADALIVGSDNVLKAIHSDGENLKTNNLVMGLDYAPTSLLPEGSPGMSRAVFVIDGYIVLIKLKRYTFNIILQINFAC